MTTKIVVPSAEELALRKISTEAVLATMEEVLGERDREVFEAHVLYGESISDLARFYGVEEQSINNRLARARRIIGGRVEAGPLGLERD